MGERMTTLDERMKALKPSGRIEPLHISKVIRYR